MRWWRCTKGTGDQRVLDALVKVYADYPVNMGATHFDDVSGLCNLDAMLETYSLSGDQRILDRALEAIAQPGVAAGHSGVGRRPLGPWPHGHPLREHPLAGPGVPLVR